MKESWAPTRQTLYFGFTIWQSRFTLMIPRSLAMPTLLAAAVAVPYGATHAPELKQQLLGAGQSATAPKATTAPTALGPTSSTPPATYSTPWTSTASPASAQSLQPTVVPTPLEGTPTYSLDEVLRMDVTKEWVYQRWARKSTALSELDLYGVRVPLVTGTQLHDLAGSLTYFFTPDGRVQRISFRGRTGDTTQLVQLVMQRYGLAWQTPSTAGEQLLELRQGDDVLSRVRTRPAPVLWANAPNESFTIDMELQDPTRARPLAPQLAPLPPLAATPSKNADAKNGDAKEADALPPVTGWKAFFPRSRVPEGQIKGLDANNLYR